MSFIRSLLQNAFYEFSFSNSDVIVTEEGSFVMLTHQIPLSYRKDYLQHYTEVFEEAEYEMNYRVVVKKIAFLMVHLGLGKEPKNYG